MFTNYETYMEAISASDADTGSVSIQVAMYSQTVPDLPPLIKEKVQVLKIVSQVAMITHVSPRIDTEWNARYSRQLSNFDSASPDQPVSSLLDRVVVAHLHCHLRSWEHGRHTLSSCSFPRRCISALS